MRMQNEILVGADPQRIYGYASSTERWPEYLPHYRYVRVLEERGNTRIVEMSAWRSRIPVRWIARQTNDDTSPAIFFEHIEGWTKGMRVRWDFVPLGTRTRVSIYHDLNFRFPVASEFIAHQIIGAFFIDNIATKTLRRMKELAETA